jgi:hypothetical protein
MKRKKEKKALRRQASSNLLGTDVVASAKKRKENSDTKRKRRGAKLLGYFWFHTRFEIEPTLQNDVRSPLKKDLLSDKTNFVDSIRSIGSASSIGSANSATPSSVRSEAGGSSKHGSKGLWAVGFQKEDLDIVAKGDSKSHAWNSTGQIVVCLADERGKRRTERRRLPRQGTRVNSGKSRSRSKRRVPTTTPIK